MFYIGKVKIEHPFIAGPMAGFTNSSYRRIVKEYGASLVYSEMISATALLYNSKKTFNMIKSSSIEHPIAIQLFGGDKESIAKAAKIVEDNSAADIIDLNLGCPAPKVIRSKSGSYWLKNPEGIYELVKEVVEATSLPVTVKIRIGWDVKNINVVEVAKLAEKAGASAIAVHARTKTQLYQGKSDWTYIKQVKDTVSIPVIGNGDVKTYEQAYQMMKETGCDGVMISRGALGNPFIFEECLKNDKKYLSYKELKAVCLRHAQYLMEEMGERIAIKEMRSIGCFYVKNIKGVAPYKVKMCSCTTYEEFKSVLDEIEKDLIINNDSI